MDEEQRLFRDVVEDLKAWNPSGSEDFIHELYPYLEQRVNIGKDGFTADKRNVKVDIDEESGNILAGKEVVIHLFTDFSEKELDELEETLQSLERKFVIFISFGVEDVDSWKKASSAFKGTYDSRVQMDFVWKEEQFFG